MPRYILNADQLLYYSLDHYLDALGEKETGDTLMMLFVYPIEDLWTKIKRKAAIRGKNAKDDKGNSLLEEYYISDDEQDLFLSWLRTESSKIFKRISAYSKLINSAFRFNVNFGEPILSSSVSSVSTDGVNIYDLSLNMTPSQYAGMKLVITTPGILENQERTIVSHNNEMFTLDSGFTSDITGLAYIISAQTEKHILIYSMSGVNKFDTNLIEGVDSLLEKMFVGSVLKEWYLIKRFMDDWKIESEMLADDVTELRRHFYTQVSTTRKFNEIF
jgi:hypothetical protein